MRSLFIISLVTFTSACQVENAIEELPLEGGDLVMLSLNPFPSPGIEFVRRVSSFILSQDDVPRWEFLESRTSNSIPYSDSPELLRRFRFRHPRIR